MQPHQIRSVPERNIIMDKAIEYAVKTVEKSLDYFYDCFPTEQSRDLVFGKFENVSWTPGFYAGLLWLTYELTGREAVLKSAKHHSRLFHERLKTKTELEHHDMGFLFSLSSMADYTVTGDTEAMHDGLEAAGWLMKRYQPEGRFIQAWGALDDPQAYRFIVDCLLNLPLLFRAHELTGEKWYYDAAYNHMCTAVKNIIRDDASTYHTFFFDKETNMPLRGETHQGFSDDSCWSRGQAWAVYGLALCYHYTKDENIIPVFNRVTEYFIEHLPEDFVPYWDLCFGDGSGEPRDTSAAAIAVCGILEMEKYYPNARFKDAAERMVRSLSDKYTTADRPESNGILKDGMYSRKHGHEPECTSWGDYFYLEALMRMKNRDWKMYW